MCTISNLILIAFTWNEPIQWIENESKELCNLENVIWIVVVCLELTPVGMATDRENRFLKPATFHNYQQESVVLSSDTPL